MRPPFVRAALLAFLLGPATVALAQDAPAQDAPALDEVLPADTVAVMLLGDVGAYRAGWLAGSPGQILADPALACQRTAVQARWSQLGDELVERYGVDPLQLLDLIDGGVALALLDFADEEDGSKRVVLGLLAEAGEDVDAVADIVDGLAESLADEADLDFASDTLADLDVGVLRHVEEDDGFELTYGFEGGWLVSTATLWAGSDAAEQGASAFADLVWGLRGEAESSLDDTPGYVSSFAARPTGLRGWCDVGRFTDLLRGAVRDEETVEWLDHAGLFELGHVGSQSSVGAEGAEEQVEVTWSGQGYLPSILSAAIGGQAPHAFRWIPPEPRQALALDLDVGAAFDAVVEAVSDADPDGGRDLLMSLASSVETLGFHPRDDFVEALDGQIGYFVQTVDASEANPFLQAPEPIGLALVLGLTDGEAMRTMIDGLVRKQGLHVARQREEFEGYELYLLPVMPGVQAAYAVTDDVLVVSTAPSLVKDVLRRQGEDGPPSLADDPDLEARSAILAGPHTALSWSPAAEGFKAFLSLLSPQGVMQVVATAGVFGVDLGPDEMQALVGAASSWLGDCEPPDPSVVDDHVDGASLAVITLEDGVLRMHSVSP